jgi:hypothetical protein
LLVPFLGLERGTQTVGVVGHPADGSGDLAGTCTGAVIPGGRVLAACAAVP